MSSKEPKRKARKKKSKEITNLLIPITLDDLGTTNDPCFGKHFSPQATECMRCGDAELCQIATTQNQHILRHKEEAKGEFMDINEKGVLGESTMKDVKKDIRKVIRKQGKIELNVLVNDIVYRHPKLLTPAKAEKLIKRMVANTDKFKLQKNHLVWNQ